MLSPPTRACARAQEFSHAGLHCLYTHMYMYMYNSPIALLYASLTVVCRAAVPFSTGTSAVYIHECCAACAHLPTTVLCDVHCLLATESLTK